MPKALSQDLRCRILAAIDEANRTVAEVAKRYDVGVASVGRLKRLRRETGSIAPRPHAGGVPRRIDEQQEALVEALVQRHPDWTEEKYAATLDEEHNIHASAVTVGRVIRRLGYSVKKSPSSPKSATAPTSSSVDAGISNESETSPLRVWFSWTKPARTSR